MSLKKRLELGVTLAALVSGCRCGSRGSNPLVATTGELQSLPALHFGNVPVGQLARLRLSVRNVGAASVEILAQTITADATGSFSEPVALKSNLPSGGASQAAVQFRPQRAGPLAATLAIEGDGEPATTSVALDGIGIELDVGADPLAVDFGPVQVGASPSPVRAVTFVNAGAAAASIAFDTGGMLSEFSIADGEGPVAAGAPRVVPGDGGTYVLEVAFAPSAVRNFPSSFGFTACTGAGACVSERAIALNGSGVDGQLAIVPNPISFDGVPAGQRDSQTLTVNNLGANAVKVGCVYLKSLGPQRCGASSSLFELGQTSVPLPATLAAAGSGQNSFTLALTYVASGGTSDADELAVDGVPVGASVSETARAPIVGDQSLGPCRLAIAPSTVVFGTVTSKAPLIKTVTFANQGQSSCGLDGLAVDPSSAAGFSLAVSQPTSITIAAGGSASVRVRFQLAGTVGGGGGVRPNRGALDYRSNDPNHMSGTVPLLAYVNPSNPYAAGWPKWHCDNDNSGQTTADTSGNDGTVLWKYAGLTSAVKDNAAGKSSSVCGGEAYLNSPIVVGDSYAGETYYVCQLSLDGTLHALSADGGLLWKRKLSSPASDPHPSTPAAVQNGDLWAVSGSEGQGKQLYLLSGAGAVRYSASYGEDGFDATPGLDPDGTLYEGDDDGKEDDGADPFSAVAFAGSGSGAVDLIAGRSLPLTVESERFGIAIADNSESYWGNNGQFFALTSPASGFGPLPAWPVAGVTVVDNSSDGNAVGPVFSDLALDPLNTGFVFTYSSWEDSTPTDCVPLIGCQAGPPYSVGGVLSALAMADGSPRWSLPLPLTQLPAGWSPLCSDYGNSAPAVATGGTVYVGNGDGLRSVDGATGHLNWLFPSANVSSSPAIGGDGTVFFGCSDGSFYAVNPTGGERFRLNLGAPVSSSPAIAADGTVFVTSDDGTVWAIR